MHISTKMENNYLRMLDEFEQAVRDWEINPTLCLTKKEVKDAYNRYVYGKSGIALSIEEKKKESDLIKRCGGLLDDC